MPDREQRCVNAIRVLAMDAVERARSGHPGMPMGMADVAFVLWTKHLRHNPANPRWLNRDRFVLSAGHGSMLLYALLYLSGVLTLDDLQNFRQWGSRTPGHPEYGHTPGVEITTGPLGQGFAAGVGMALAERWLAERFNRPGYPVVDHYTYAIVSDGDLMEGVSYEAASLAGHLGLGRLIYLYDDNEVSIDGSTDLTFTEDVRLRFTACGWHVLEVDGHDRLAVDQALIEARAELDRPSLIICHTHIAYGSPGKQDTAAAHGAPLGPDEVRRTKQALGWPEEPPFFVPQEVLDYFASLRPTWQQFEDEWNAIFVAWRAAYPELAAEWDTAFSRTLPSGWDAALPTFTNGQQLATREASGLVLNALAPRIPFLV
ncbi:transketolase, partial [Thermomicrobium sp. CFH 73360]